jgi:CheY-like chemotaxis protein
VRGTILIVEDDHDTRVALRRCLEDEDFFIVTATNGANALEQLSHMTAPLFILLDINMPMMSGDQFLQVIQEDPKLKSIPVIQMSASKTPRLMGTTSALAKPLKLETLLEAIEQTLATLERDKTKAGTETP